MSLTQYRTSHPLLRRAVDSGDDEAWQELVSHYRCFLYHVLNQLKVPQSDIDDVAQQALLMLTRDLSDYDRSKGRFRTWLRQVIRNTALMHFRKTNTRNDYLDNYGNDPSVSDWDQMPEIESLIENEWANYIVSQAMERVKQSYKGQAIKAFELGMQGLTAAEVAEQTGLTVSSVYTLQKRVKRSMYIEVRSLVADLER